MTHIDLFSGIGGFALAAKWTWGEDYHNVGHSEIEEFPCKVYHKHFPESECLGDIKKVEWSIIANTRRKSVEAQTLRRRERFREGNEVGNLATSSRGTIGLLTGGFPCQPFSVAGQRKGSGDDRHLWPQCLRAVQDIQPRWVIFENVPGIESMELESVLSDLENEGYTNCEGQTKIIPLVIPACAVNAPHRRDRVWVVAHSIDDSDRTERGALPEADSVPQVGRSTVGGRFVDGTVDDAPHSRRQHGTGSALRRESQEATGQGSTVEPQRPTPRYRDRDAADGNQPRPQGHGNYGERAGERTIGPGTWEESWYEVATRLCRVDDGLSGGMVRPKGWRVNALKALGNGIVPQVAHEIMKAIKGYNLPALGK